MSVFFKPDVHSGDVTRGIDPISAVTTSSGFFSSFDATTSYAGVPCLKESPEKIKGDTSPQEKAGNAEKTVKGVFHNRRTFNVLESLVRQKDLEAELAPSTGPALPLTINPTPTFAVPELQLQILALCSHSIDLAASQFAEQNNRSTQDSGLPWHVIFLLTERSGSQFRIR